MTTGNLFPIRSIKVEKLKPTPAVIGQEAEPSLGSLHSITGVRETTNHSSGFYSPADVARSLSTSWGWPVCLQIALLPDRHCTVCGTTGPWITVACAVVRQSASVDEAKL